MHDKTGRHLMRHHSNYHYKGFTLTELAIVLGIIGSILAAIWSAASMTQNKNRINRANNEILTIASNIRALYSTRGSFSQTTQMNDITAAMVSANVFPSDMTSTNQAYPQNPWGGATIIHVVPNAPNADNTMFEIEFYAGQAWVSESGHTFPCAALLALTAQDANLLYIYDNVDRWQPVTANMDATSFQNCNGNLAWEFSLK